MADSISDARNTARSMTNAADSFVGFSDQGVAPQKSENEHRQPSVEKDAALRTCQARLEPDGSKTGLLDNLSEQGDSMSSEKPTAEQRRKHFERLEKLEKRFNELLPKLASVFTEDETEIVQSLIDADEFPLALETLVDFVNESSKTISQKVFSEIIETAEMMMKVNMTSVESRLVGRVSDE